MENLKVEKERLEFEDFADHFFFDWVNKKFSQELQNLYREDIGKMKAGYWAGIRAVLSYDVEKLKNLKK